MNELSRLRQSAETWSNAVVDPPQAFKIEMALDAIKGLADYIALQPKSTFYLEQRLFCMEITNQMERKVLRITVSQTVKDKIAAIREKLRKEVSAATVLPEVIHPSNHTKRSCDTEAIKTAVVGIGVLALGYFFSRYF